MSLRILLVVGAGMVSAHPLPPDEEASVGHSLAEQVFERTTLIDRPAVQDYVESIGWRIARQLPGKPQSFYFAATREDASRSVNPAHEPLLLSGGYVFVPASLLVAAHREAEFAGMLAHTVAHSSHRRYIRSARGQFDKANLEPFVFLGGWERSRPTSAEEVARVRESAMDVKAAAVMARAGFDPCALPVYLARMQQRERAEVLALHIRKMPARNYSESGDFDRIQQLVRSMAE